MTRCIILFCILCLAAACPAGAKPLNPNVEFKPSYEYEDERPKSAPRSHAVEQEPFEIVPYTAIVNASYNNALATLEANIAATGFTLNTVNASAGIITCALKTNKPEDFVDMGVTTRTYGHEAFVYPTAAAASYKLPYVNKNNDYYIVRRDTSLNCLATLQLRAVNEKQTKVSVSINYIFTVNTSYENTAFRKSAPPNTSVTVNFLTNIMQETNLGDAERPIYVVPQSNGVLEQRLLNAALAD